MIVKRMAMMKMMMKIAVAVSALLLLSLVTGQDPSEAPQKQHHIVGRPHADSSPSSGSLPLQEHGDVSDRSQPSSEPSTPASPSSSEGLNSSDTSTNMTTMTGAPVDPSLPPQEGTDPPDAGVMTPAPPAHSTPSRPRLTPSLQPNTPLTPQPPPPSVIQTSSPEQPPLLPSSRPPSRAKTQEDSPPQLNVGEEADPVSSAPSLDPLLAGLVAAFIITAIIITLLVFIRLRRHDNQPEFHRLQDLPMDDMMEDTPLSMYNY